MKFFKFNRTDKVVVTSAPSKATKQKFDGPGILDNPTFLEIMDGVVDMLAYMTAIILTGVFAGLPFILIQDQDGSEFWQSLGYFGVYMWGLSAIMRGSGRGTKRNM